MNYLIKILCLSLLTISVPMTGSANEICDLEPNQIVTAHELARITDHCVLRNNPFGFTTFRATSNRLFYPEQLDSEMFELIEITL